MRALTAPSEIAPAFAVVGALLGHNWSVIIAQLARKSVTANQPANAYDYVKDFFAKAKGGAGVATTGGAALVLYWPPTIPLIIIGIGLVLIFHYSSISSITVAVLYPVVMAYFVFTGAAPPVYLLMSLIVAAILLYVHIPNMKRLRAGTESKFGQRLGRERKPTRAENSPR
jgi:glycerol-3-phosphate acyltransferase PlsY